MRKELWERVGGYQDLWGNEDWDFWIAAVRTGIEAIRIPAPAALTGGAYVKFERKVGDYAIAAAAAQLSLDPDGTISQAGMALTNLAYAMARSTRAEEALRGQPPSDPAFAAAAEAELDAAQPLPDNAFKVGLLRNVISQTLAELAEETR